MTYRIAGIDVHKKMLAVVGTDIAVDGAFTWLVRSVEAIPPAGVSGNQRAVSSRTVTPSDGMSTYA